MADLREYVRELEARRAKGETVPELTVGRIVNGKYFVNNQEVSKEQYDRANADSSEAIRKIKEQPTPGLEDLESFATRSRTLKGVNRPSMEERRRSALSELDGMKKGGKPKMLKSKISTATKSKKSPAW
jgi:hypothetical protein